MAEWQNLPDYVLDYLDATVAAHGIDALETYVEMIRAERGESQIAFDRRVGV